MQNSMRGYLATITSYEENEFVKNKVIQYYSSNQTSVWISGTSVNSYGVYRFNSGPEKGELIYNLYTDRCNMFCDWSLYEPNMIIPFDEPYIAYEGKDFYNWNNLDPLPSFPLKSYALVCEYGGMEQPFIPSVRTIGDQNAIIRNIDSSWNLNPGDENILSVHFKGKNDQFDIQSIKVISSSSIQVSIPPGSGVYNVTLKKNNLSLNTTFQFQSPYISTVYIPSLTSGALLTLTGDNFGSNKSDISIIIGSQKIQCNNINFLNQFSITCKTTQTISQYIYPILITVNTLVHTANKPVIRYNNRFFSCFQMNGNFTTATKYSENQQFEGLQGYLSYVDTVQTDQFLSLLCQNNSWSKYPLYWTSLYYSNSNYYSYTYPKKDSIVPVYSVNTPTLPSSYFIYNFTSHSLISLATTTGYSVLTELFSKDPIFISPKIYYINTTGDTLSIQISGGGTIVDSYKFNYRGLSFPINNRDFYSDNSVDFIVGAGYGGPYSLSYSSVIGSNTKTTQVNSTIIYNPPYISKISLNLIPVFGYEIIIQGYNFYSSTPLVSVNIDNNIQCSNVTMVTNHYSLKCIIPPGYGSNSINLKLNDVTSNSLPFNYIKPTISNISKIDTNDGWLTINGDNIFTNTSILSITVSKLNCQNITIISEYRSLKCYFKIPIGSLNGTQSVVLSQNGTLVSYPFEFEKPIIRESTPGYFNKTSKITIFGEYFGSMNLTVSIGNDTCYNISRIDSNTINCYFDGKVPQINNKTLIVNVSSSGISGWNQVFYYESELPCPSKNEKVCSGNGNCSHQTCSCFEGWTLKDCSQPTNGSGGIPNTNNGTIVNPTVTMDFVSSITHLRELDPNGNPFKTLSMNNIKWVNQSSGILLGTFVNESVQVELILSYYENSTTIIFAGQSIVIPENSIKFVISISNWSFSSRLNSFEVIMMSETSLTSQYNCELKQTNGSLSGNSYYIITGGSVLQVSFASHLFVDQRISQAEYHQLSNNDPIVTEAKSNNNNKDKYQYFLSISVPNFEESVLIDPSMQSLVLPSQDENENQCHIKRSDKKWKVIVISVVCAVVGVAIVSAAIYTLQKKYRFRKDDKQIEMKLQS